jgi:hypothetical protein
MGRQSYGTGLRFREVQEALKEMIQMLQEMGMDAQRLQEFQQMMQATSRPCASRSSSTSPSASREHEQRRPSRRADSLYNQPFEQLTEDDMQILRHEVRRLAAALRTRLALRLKRARTGQLDVKGTLRANLKNGSVPIELKHRDRIQKPKIVVLCDLSTSMRHISELMLSFLYSNSRPVSKTRAIAFTTTWNTSSEFFNINNPSGPSPTSCAYALRPLQHRPGPSAWKIVASDYMDAVDSAHHLTSWSATDATTSTIPAWRSSVPSPAPVVIQPSGSTPKKCPNGAAATATCSNTPPCAA